MTNKELYELVMLAKSARNNMQRKYKGQFNDQVEIRCKEFCNEHNINITHGSAYKEVCHKFYYYVDKYVDNLNKTRTDLYNFRKNHILTDKEILDKLIKEK